MFCDLEFGTWVLVILSFGTSDTHDFRTWDTVLWDFKYTGFGTWDTGLGVFEYTGLWDLEYTLFGSWDIMPWNFGYKEL